MKRNLLLTPGPTKIPPEVCEVLGKPMIHHRTPEFQECLKEAEEGLKYVFQTKNDIYFLAASGTGGLEASVCSLLSPGDKAVTVEGGKFGERWTELCHAYGIEAKVVDVQWGKAVQPQQIQELLDQDKNIKVVFITLCETSTGVTTDVKAIAEVVKKTPAVLVVDAVSGLGVTDLRTDDWEVDVVVSASHKGFMLPPGVAFVCVNPKAQALMEQSKSPRYYFDLRKLKKAWEKTDTPFTPAIGIIRALTVSIKWMKGIGLEDLFHRYAHLAQGTREAAKALGLELFADPVCISNVLTPITLPGNIDGGKLVKTMRDTHGISIAGGQGHLKGKMIRIAHMGCIDQNDIMIDYYSISKLD